MKVLWNGEDKLEVLERYILTDVYKRECYLNICVISAVQYNTNMIEEVINEND